MKFVSLLAASTLALTLTASAQQTRWMATGSSLNWSDTGNWDSGVPNSTLMTYFDELYTGYTNGVKLVNNIVDSNFIVGGLTYDAFAVTNTFDGTPSHYYTTLIPAGVGLGVAGIDGMPSVRVGFDFASYNNGTIVATIMGPGSLFVTNTTSTISVSEGSSPSGTHKATLDLSGLGSLTATVSNVLIGVSPTFDKASGALLLPATSVITTAPNPDVPGVLLGRGMTNTGFGSITLGTTTTFNTDGLVVGGARSSFGLNLLSFQPPVYGVPSTRTFTLRGSAAGTARAAVFSIGDNSANETNYLSIANGNGAGSSSSPSTADFTAGSVDALTTNLYVGRSAADNALLPSGANAGTGVGSLLFNNGTINALSAWIGFKQGTNRSPAIGNITARGNAVLIVSNDLTLAQVTNTVTGVTATLNVNDNATVNVGGNMLTKGGTSTLNFNGGTVNMTGGGNVSANTLSGFGTINNAGAVVVSNTVTLGIVNANGVQPGTLNVGGNLTLATGVATKFKLGASTTIGNGINDYLNLTGNLTLNNNNLDLGFAGMPVTGAYDLVDYTGTKSGSFNLVFINTTRNMTFALDQATPNHVRVLVGGGPPASLTWKGGANGVWDLTNNINWNNNTEKFYTLDNVLFDDTGAQSIIQIPSSATVLPGNITFNNNSKIYTLYAPGKISGCAGVTKNGSGTVIWDTQSANDFTGPININQGTIQIQSVSGTANFFGTTNKLITIANGASLDIYGNTVGSSSPGVGWPITFSGNGVGGIGAIAHTKPSSGPTLFTPQATLAADATIGATTSGVNLFVAGISTVPLGGTFDLAGHTLTTTGGGNIGLVNLLVTNAGDIHVASANFILRDVIVDGAGTISAGNSTISLGNLNGLAWTTGYVAKAISIGPGLIVAPGSNNVVIPVSSPITLSGALTVSNAQWVRFSGIISGNNGLTKIGPGRVTLAGTNTYAGATIVSGGTLALDSTGSVANSPLVQVDPAGILDVNAQPGSYNVPVGQILQVDGTLSGSVTVPTGATLAGSGTIPGTVVVNGGTVTPGKLDALRTLTVGNLSLSNASFVFELDAQTLPGGPYNDLVAVSQLSLPGTNTIKIVPVGSLNTSGGQYTLFTYSGPTLPSSVVNNFVLTSDTRYTFSFVDPATTPGALMITVSGGQNGLVWQGGVTGAETAWNINITPNWNNGFNADTFFNGDAVTFDDTGLTNRADFVGGLRPATINMANNILPYTFAGTGNLRTGAITNNGTAGLTIANNNDNTLSGAGLFLNAGSVTFNQPVNATFTGTLNGFGSGAVNKEGANRLTLTGNSATTYYGPVNLNAGTVRVGSTNALGAGAVTVADGATLDINGQMLDAPTVRVSGTGVGGLGAIVNTGPQQTNALSMVALAGDTTLNSSNRWDVRGGGLGFQGNNFAVTKIGPGDIWVDVGSDTGLGDVDIQQGRLVFAWSGTDVGNPTNVITVHSNASLAFGMDVRASGKSVAVLPGGDLEAFAYTGVSPSIGRSNSFAGNVSFGGPGLVRIANLAGLELQGTVQGPAGLVNADRGTLTLSGSNSYAGDVTVNLGQLTIASPDALPPNTTVTLNCTGIPSSDIVLASLVSNTATPPSVTLNMISYRSPSGNLTPQLTGQGTWQGPIVMNAVQTDPSQTPQFTFAAGSNLVIGGTVTQTGSPLAQVNINGFPGTVVFKSPLIYNGTMTMGSQGLGVDDLSQKYTTMELDAAGNSFTNMTFWRGKLIVGVDNAIPVTCPMTIPAIRTDNDARNIIDLHGHSQVFSNFPGAAGFAGNGAAPLWIGSDNTNADSTIVFTSPLTNTWYAWLLDNIDTNLVTTHRTGLSVTSGNLRLANLVWANWVYGGPAGATNNTYSGPTLVTGGTLQVDAPILNSTVTVSGAGRLAGSGPIYTPITIGAGSTLSPGGTATTGSAIGILTNYNNLTLLSGSKCVFEVNLGTRTNDSVFGPANVTYGGTLVITNIGTQAFTNGAILKLFTATNYTPGTVSIQPAVPGTNLMWDASQLAVNGTLRVTTTIPTSISGVGHLNDGNVAFTITGGVGQAYSVRASSNVAAPVASWTVLESGILQSANYTFTDLNATNYPTRFYIISTP